MTTQILTDMTPHFTTGMFIFLVVMMVATSPVLALALGYMAYRWMTSPFRKDEEEPFGDWPHIEGRH